MDVHSGTTPSREAPRFRWYATINNFSEEDIETLLNLPHSEILIAKEEAPSTGTPHLHVYLALVDKKRLLQMKTLVPKAHWEPVKNRDACIAYCEKDGEILHKNLRSVQKRELCAAIEHMTNEGLAGVAREFPYQYVLHQRGLQALQCARLADIPKPCP